MHGAGALRFVRVRRYEVEKLTASQRLDLNLEKGRMRDELQVGPTSAPGLGPAALEAFSLAASDRSRGMQDQAPHGRQCSHAAQLLRRHLLMRAMTWPCHGGQVVLDDAGISRPFSDMPVARDLHLWLLGLAVNPLQEFGSSSMAVWPANTRWHCIGWRQVSEVCDHAEMVARYGQLPPKLAAYHACRF